MRRLSCLSTFGALSGFNFLAAASTVLGAAGALITPVAHADDTLLSADGALSDSETAIIVGATTAPTPSTEYAQAVENLYLNPLGFGGGATDSAVCDMVGVAPCSDPLQVLTTPALLEQGPSSLEGESLLVQAVQNEVNSGDVSAEHPLTIFGYSQSATIDTLAMTQLAQDGVPSADLQFVLIGDPDTPTGAWVNVEPALASLIGSDAAKFTLDLLGFDGVLGVGTPTDLYPTTIYELNQDPASDFVADFQAGGILDPILRVLDQHIEYLGLTPAEIANSTSAIDGDVTSIDISDANINYFQALAESVENGALNSGILQSLFGTVLLELDQLFDPSAVF